MSTELIGEDTGSEYPSLPSLSFLEISQPDEEDTMTQSPSHRSVGHNRFISSPSTAKILILEPENHLFWASRAGDPLHSPPIASKGPFQNHSVSSETRGTPTLENSATKAKFLAFASSNHKEAIRSRIASLRLAPPGNTEIRPAISPYEKARDLLVRWRQLRSRLGEGGTDSPITEFGSAKLSGFQYFSAQKPFSRPKLLAFLSRIKKEPFAYIILPPESSSDFATVNRILAMANLAERFYEKIGISKRIYVVAGPKRAFNFENIVAFESNFKARRKEIIGILLRIWRQRKSVYSLMEWMDLSCGKTLRVKDFFKQLLA